MYVYAAPTCDFAPLPNHQIHADSHSLSLSLALFYAVYQSAHCYILFFAFS